MAEPATVACPACGKGYRLRDELAGRKVRCGACDAVLLLPAQPGFPALLVKPGSNARDASRTKGRAAPSAPVSARRADADSPSTQAAGPSPGGQSPAATPGASDGYELDLPDLPEAPSVAPPPQPAASADADEIDPQPDQEERRPGSILFQGRGDRNLDDLHADPAGDVYMPVAFAVLGVVMLLYYAVMFRATPEASLLQAGLEATFTVLLAVPALGLGAILVMVAFASPLDPLPLSLRKLGALSLFMCGLDLLVYGGFNRINEGLNESGLALQYSIPLQVFISLSLWFGLTRRLTECEVFDTLALWLFARVAPAVAGVLAANWLMDKL